MQQINIKLSIIGEKHQAGSLSFNTNTGFKRSVLQFGNCN